MSQADSSGSPAMPVRLGLACWLLRLAVVNLAWHGLPAHVSSARCRCHTKNSFARWDFPSIFGVHRIRRTRSFLRGLSGFFVVRNNPVGRPLLFAENAHD